MEIENDSTVEYSPDFSSPSRSSYYGSRLDLLKSQNPLYGNMDDDAVLANAYDQYYRNRITFEDYRRQMLEPMTPEIQNRIANERYQALEKFSLTDVANQTLRDRGKMTFGEGFRDNDISDLLPFAADAVDIYQNRSVTNIVQKAYNGIKLNDNEQRKFAEYLKEIREYQLRGATTGYRISSNLLNLIRIPIEFKMTGALGTKLGLATKVLSEAPLKTKLLSGVVSATNRTLLTSPVSVTNAYQARKLAGMLAVTETGEALFSEFSSRGFSLKTLLKASGDIFVSNYTELVGGDLGRGLVAGADRALLSKIPLVNGVVSLLRNASRKVFGSTLGEALRQFGFDGLVEETFEEYLENPLRQMLGLEDNEYTLQNFLGSFDWSLDEFLQTIGAVTIQGGVSFTAANLMTRLKSLGMKPADLNRVNSLLTEEQKRQKLSDIDNEMAKQDEEFLRTRTAQLKEQLLSSDLFRNEGLADGGQLSAQMAEVELKTPDRGRIKTINDFVDKFIGNVYLKKAMEEGVPVRNIMDMLSLEFRTSDEGRSLEDNGVNSFYQINPEIEKNINELLELAKQPDNRRRTITISKVSDELANVLRENGISVDGYRHDVDSYAVRHIKKRHGVSREKLVGQLPITNDDIKKIPYIIDNYDYIKIGTKTIVGNEGITYIKTMPDGTTFYVEEVKDRRKALLAKTMYKKRSRYSIATMKNTGEDLTSETTATSTKIIPNPNLKVNKNSLDQGAKGRITFSGDGKAIVDLFRNSDPSTLVHELGHYFMRLTELLASRGSLMARNDLDNIRKITGNFGGEFTKAQNEIFARQFEAYVFSGEIRSMGNGQSAIDGEEVKNIFEKFRDWLRDIYESIGELNIHFNDNVKDFFDNFLFGTEEQQRALRERMNGRVDGLKIDYDDLRDSLADGERSTTTASGSPRQFELFQGDPSGEMDQLKAEIDRFVSRLKEEEGIEDQDLLDERVSMHFGHRQAELESKIYSLELAKREIEEMLGEDRDNDEKQPLTESRVGHGYVPTSAAFREKKMNEYIDRYNDKVRESIIDQGYRDSLQRDLDSIPGPGPETSGRLRATEGDQRKIVGDLFAFVDRIFSREIQEERDYGNSLLKAKNRYIEEVNETMGEQLLKPHRNLKELIARFEERNRDRNYIERVRYSREIMEENDQGEGLKDYELTLEEYDRLVNFQKKYLKEHLNELLANVNKSQDLIKNQQNEIFRKTGALNDLREQLDYYLQYEKLIEFDREFRNQAEQHDYFLANIRYLQDEEARISIERMYYRRDRSFEKIMELVNRGVEEQTRNSFIKSIREILKSSSHITRKGKEYGRVMYEDSGLFDQLKKIARYSMKHAREELKNLEEDRRAGKNLDNERDYTLKRELLYLFGNRNIDVKNMEKIVHDLGQLRRESSERLQEIRRQSLLDQFGKIVEISGAIRENKILGNRPMKFLAENFFVNQLGNLEDLLSYVTNERIARELSPTENEMAYRVSTDRRLGDLLTKMKNILAIGDEDANRSQREAAEKGLEERRTKREELTRELKDLKNDILDSGYRLKDLESTAEGLSEELRESRENPRTSPSKLRELKKKARDSRRERMEFKKQLEAKGRRLGELRSAIKKLEDRNRETWIEDGRRTLDNKIEEWLKPLATLTPENNDGQKLQSYEIDTFGLMDIYLQLKNPQTAKVIGYRYANDMARINELLDSMTEEQLKIADLLAETVQDRDRLNPYYVLVFDRDMGNVENYFPRTSYSHDMPDFFNLNVNKDLSKVSAVEHRSLNSVPKFGNALAKTANHLRQTEFVIHMAPKLKALNQLLTNSSTRNSIEKRFGQKTYKNLLAHLESLQMNQFSRYSTTLEDLQVHMLGSWAGAKTNTPSVLLKQLTSFIPYAEGKNKRLFLKNYIYGLMHFDETKKFMLETSEYLKFRYGEKEYNRIAEKLRPSENSFVDVLDRVNIFKKINWKSLALLGDMLSVVYGGYARYRTSLDMGMNHEEAMADMERQTTTTQQSELKTLKSNVMKRSGLLNIMGNLFKSQEQQYLGKSSMAIVNLIKNDLDTNPRETLVIYNLVVPLVLTLVSGIIDFGLGKRKKDPKYYLFDFLVNAGTSFFGLNYIYFTLRNLVSSYRSMNLKKLLLNVLDTLTGLPVEYYEKAVFDRKYGRDLYDSPKEKKAKEKRIGKAK
jgi:hypothetical protein